MYGWRAKLGLLIPANNTVIEPELTAYLPTGVTAYATRMVVEGPFESKALLRMEQSAQRGIGELAQSHVHVMVYCCMSTSLVKGRDWDEAFTRRLAVSEANQDSNARGVGAPSTLFTAAGATMEALTALGARRVAVLSPYPVTIHPLLAPFFASYGIEIEANVNLEIADLAAVNRVDPGQVYREARALLTPGAEAICLLATDMPTFPAIAQLEEDTGVPVVSTNQAILWRSLAASGVRDSVSGLGRLLAQMPEPAPPLS